MSSDPRDVVPGAENPLEEALSAAPSSPEAEQTFYRLLLESPLYIIDDAEGPRPTEHGVTTLQPGYQIRVVTLDIRGVPHTPIFSSLTRLRAVVDVERRYLAMNGRELLEIVQGAHLVLNPGSTLGKYFVPEETAALLSGDIFRSYSESVLTEDTQYMLGQPAVYPTHIADALAARFQTLPDVTAAYLAHCVLPGSDEPQGRTLIGIDAEGDWESVLEAAMRALRQATPNPETVNIVRVDDSELGVYFRTQTTPFYLAPPR
jgi:hypothetical protein